MNRNIPEAIIKRNNEWQGRMRGVRNGVHMNVQEEDTDFTPLEDFLIEWSVASVGRSWNIVADILHNHPFASGHLRDPAKVQERYIETQIRKGKRYHKTMKLDPTADEKVPILGRFKPYFLTNRMLPVYPQRYALTVDYFKKEEEKSKSSAEKRHHKPNISLDCEMRELKYKSTYEDNPINLLAKNNRVSYGGSKVFAGSKKKNRATMEYKSTC